MSDNETATSNESSNTEGNNPTTPTPSATQTTTSVPQTNTAPSAAPFNAHNPQNNSYNNQNQFAGAPAYPNSQPAYTPPPTQQAYPSAPQAAPLPAYGYQTPGYGVKITPPLDQPWYGIDFGSAVVRFFKKYATFSGRASRSEYWWAWLALNIAYLVLAFIAWIPFLGSFIAFIFWVATIIPTISISFRRLHDANKPGWLYFLPLALYVIGFFIGIFSFFPALISLNNGNDMAGLGILSIGSIAFLLLEFIGWVLSIVLMLLPSNPEGARFDKAPMPQPFAGQPAPTQAPLGQPGYGQPGYPAPTYGQGAPAPQPPAGQPPYPMR